MPDYKRAAITGVGALTPIGNDAASFGRALVAGVSGAASITQFDASKFKTHFACEAKNLGKKGNRVIIVGRSEARLQAAAAPQPGVTTIAADINDSADVTRLVQQVQADFSDLSGLINNAGQASAYKLTAGADAFTKACAEIATNYLAMVNLTELLLPVLNQQAEAFAALNS